MVKTEKTIISPLKIHYIYQIKISLKFWLYEKKNPIFKLNKKILYLKLFFDIFFSLTLVVFIKIENFIKFLLSTNNVESWFMTNNKNILTFFIHQKKNVSWFIKDWLNCISIFFIVIFLELWQTNCIISYHLAFSHFINLFIIILIENFMFFLIFSLFHYVDEKMNFNWWKNWKDKMNCFNQIDVEKEMMIKIK